MHQGMIDPTATPLLDVRDLVKEYHTKDAKLRSRVSRAVDGVSFQIWPGETLAIVGESGSGKSTVGRVLLRLTELTSGTVTFAGDDVTELSDRSFRSHRRHLQIVFQDPLGAFNPRTSIRASLREFVELTGERDRRIQDSVIDDAIRDVGLEPEVGRRRPSQVSGGQLQRLSVARALLVDPKLLFLDEPTSALDVSIRGQIVNLLLDLQAREGLAYLLVAHDLRVVDAMADRVAVMYLGQFVEVGRREDVFERPRHPYTRGLLHASDLETPSLEQEPVRLTGELSEEHAKRPGCRLTPRCPFVESRCHEPQGMLPVAEEHLVRCWKAAQPAPSVTRLSDPASERPTGQEHSA